MSNSELIFKKKVIILMATYNGEKYIREQINSILMQSFTNWELLIRDDNSSDDTMRILEEYEKNEARVKILRDNLGNVGQCANFDLLMQHCLAEDAYFMFADQDDIWNPNKIELSIKKIIDVEKSSNYKTPILIYTNYVITDSNLLGSHVAYRSTLHYSKYELACRLLVQNWVMGCTVIINKSLLELSINIPSEAENHDNWMAIIASLAGKIAFLNETTMKHRIHSNNVTTQTHTTSFKARILRVYNRFKTNDRAFEKRTRLLNHIKNRVIRFVDQEGLEIVKNYSDTLQTRGFKALSIAYKSKFFGVNKIQTMLFFMQLYLKKSATGVKK